MQARRLVKRGLLGSLFLLTLVLSSCAGPKNRWPFFRVQFQGNTSWIFGGTSYVSTDGGAQWEPLSVGYHGDSDSSPIELRNRIQFVDQNTGFHSFEGPLMRSTDAGRSWNKVGNETVLDTFFLIHLYSRELSDVCYMSEKEIYVIRGSRFLRSNDKGKTWVEIREFPSPTVFRIKRQENSLWLVGGKGFCSKYSPDKNLWQQFDVPTTAYLCDLGFVKDWMIVVGAFGTLFVSSAATPRWEKIDLGVTDDLVSIDFSPDGTAFLVGGHRAPSLFFTWPGRIALTSKDYRHWQELSLP